MNEELRAIRSPEYPFEKLAELEEENRELREALGHAQRTIREQAEALREPLRWSA